MIRVRFEDANDRSPILHLPAVPRTGERVVWKGLMAYVVGVTWRLPETGDPGDLVVWIEVRP